jgi:hypothetical protein
MIPLPASTIGTVVFPNIGKILVFILDTSRAEFGKTIGRVDPVRLPIIDVTAY